MTLPLTVETLRAAYDFLATTPPFNKWNLRSSEEITFKVAKTRQIYGWHHVAGRGKRRRHLIAVSSTSIGHTTSLMATVAHELVHMHMAITGMDKGCGEHGYAFDRIAKSVCKYHGFDPKTF